MNQKVIDGKAIAKKVFQQLIIDINKLNLKPKLVIFTSKPDARSKVYINMKVTHAKEAGIDVEIVELAKYSPDECKNIVYDYSKKTEVSGIITQLPLHGWYDPQILIDCINPAKDVDGLTSTNQENLEKNLPGLYPATPLAIMRIFDECGIDLGNKTVCVVGRSALVGNPLRIMLEHKGLKVLVGHSQTKNLKKITNKADILISATGQPKLITADMVKSSAVVIDVGINDIGGKLQGDVDFDNVVKVASLITPVPGGVGPITVAMLLQNVVQAAKNLT